MTTLIKHQCRVRDCLNPATVHDDDGGWWCEDCWNDWTRMCLPLLDQMTPEQQQAMLDTIQRVQADREKSGQ